MTDRTDKLAHYELLAPIGAGGMGEVFRARDTRLDRDVAVKILPPALARDPERIARFDREAKTLASLQHPNIATVHDFMTVDGVSFLVMELVEGEDLSERLAKGPIEVDETRQLAIQIAAGLEAAHERNIVHRDLKPANVKITPEGQIKILDFGLARAVTGDSEDGSDPMLSPTITQAMTQAGTILGTAAYMSPEQARGKRVDKRADIWAFGVLVYEMLTGERLFDGETTSDTLASVLKNPVDFDRLDGVPRDIIWVLQRCLDRNPTRRLRDIGEARLVLSGESTVSQMGVAAAQDPEPGRAMRLWPLIAAALAVALLASIVMRPQPQEADFVQMAIPMPADISMLTSDRQPGPPAMSPDGQAVVFSGAGPDGDVYLWYRRLADAQAHRLEGTKSASYPFWSPDSRSVGFFSDQGLMRLEIGAGSPLRLTDVQFGKGATWSPEGRIVYAPSYNSPLKVILASGGDLPRQVTVFDSVAGDNSHRHPFFLPDGEHFLYLARGARDSTGAGRNTVRVGSLSSNDDMDVTGSQGHAEVHDGRLIFARDDALVAQGFDPVSFQLHGDPQVILPSIETLGQAARSMFSMSLNHRMVYVPGGAGNEEELVSILDREGRTQRQVGPAAAIQEVVVSPDFKRAALVQGPAGGDQNTIWTLNLETGTSSRFAAGGNGVQTPVWSPDGKYIAYSEQLDRGVRILVRRVDGGGAPVELISIDNRRFYPQSWSPSGRYLVYSENLRDLGYVELDQEVRRTGDLIKIVDGAEGARSAWGATFLGNDNWIAYHATEQGTLGLFVCHIMDPARRFKISSVAGIYPSFDPVSGQIGFAEIGTQQFTVMDVSFRDADSDPVMGTPHALFRLPGRGGDYAIDFRGDRIILSTGGTDDSRMLPLYVSDWHRLLRE